MNACSAKTDPTVVEGGQASRKVTQWTLYSPRFHPYRVASTNITKGKHCNPSLCAQNQQPSEYEQKHAKVWFAWMISQPSHEFKLIVIFSFYKIGPRSMRGVSAVMARG